MHSTYVSKEYDFWINNSTKLNDILINLKGTDIGFIPLSNLIPEAKGMDVNVLATLYEKDGLKLQIQNYKDEGDELLIYVK